MKVRMALPDKKSLGIIALLAGGIIGLFFLWGFYGTSLTLFIGFSIWLMLLAALTPIRDKAQWVYVFMLISGAAALFTLNRLYNPSIKVFSNAQHHALNLTGFETDAHDIALMGAEISKGSPYILRYHSAQPVYARLTGNKDSLLNKASLPYFDKSFTLVFRDSLGLTVSVEDILRPDRKLEWLQNKISPQPKDSCAIEIKLLKEGKEVAKYQAKQHRMIRRHLSLYDIMSNLSMPDGFQMDLKCLAGITLLREIAGAAVEEIPTNHFYLSFTPQALTHIRTLQSNSRTYQATDLMRKDSIAISEGTSFRIGTGADATPYIYLTSRNQKTFVGFDSPYRFTLPVDRDSIDSPQTIVVTSRLSNITSSKMSMGLYYPVFAQQDDHQQFSFILQYLPEKTLTPLVCKIQSLDNNVPIALNGDGYSPITQLSAGDSFVLKQKNRELSPVFSFENLRNSSIVRFTTQKGYLLIFAVLLGVFISISFNKARKQRPLDGKVETLVWLTIITLLVVRAFIAWRTAVFPPLDELSTKGLTTYEDDQYTFWATLIAIGAFTLALVVYKLASPFKLPRKHYGWFLILALLSIVLLAVAGLVTSNERMMYIFIPVSGLFLSEWGFMNYKDTDSAFFQTWGKRVRYGVMVFFAIYTLILDAGFGIVFTLFLLLYNALLRAWDLSIKKDDADKGAAVKQAIINIIYVMVFIGMALILSIGGMTIIPFIYTNPWFLYLTVFIFLSLFVFSIRVPKTTTGGVLTVAVVIAFSILLGYVGNIYLSNHRHNLYRSEIHIKPISSILMDEQIESRNLERLFEASQNQWYLDYYMQGRTIPQMSPFTPPYELRSHSDKGISWHAQKTDAVLNRYVIGEHSMMTAAALIGIFMTLFLILFGLSKGDDKRNILATGAALLLLCQAAFITLATTNHFIFFGQDYPLISQHSLLTILFTFTLFFIITTSTASEVRENEATPIGKKSLLVLVVTFVLFTFAGRNNLDSNGQNFNVGDALKETKNELDVVNRQLRDFVDEQRENLEKLKIINGTGDIQEDYSAFINYFDRQTGMCDTLISLSQRPQSGISPFTASLYKLYRDKLSKINNPTDIIHLRMTPDHYWQLNINNEFFQQKAPESVERGWRGSIIPQHTRYNFSTLALQNEDSTHSFSIGYHAARIDSKPELTYNYPVYLAKVDNDWVVGETDYYIIGKESQDVTIHSGADKYVLSDASGAAYYMNIRPGDYVETTSEANNKARLYIKGDYGRYFAKNLLVNGRHMMLYPMGEKFLYPLHLSQVAEASLSGKDKELRRRDLKLSLSYTLTDDLFDDLNDYSSRPATDARSLIVADGDGKIKALITTRNNTLGNPYLDPNDHEQVTKLQNQFYLTGHVDEEEKTFGELNFLYLKPGPGSSIKPLTFTSVMSQAYYDWRKFALYLDAPAQGLHIFSNDGKKYIRTGHYAGGDISFQSIYYDETGNEEGLTDISRYIQKSSNFFNSTMVFLGFYEGPYLTKEFAKVTAGKESSLFIPYSEENQKNRFPTMQLMSNGNRKLFNFRNWLMRDGMPRHENGALQMGYHLNFGLWKDNPYSLFAHQREESIDLLGDPEVFDVLSLSRFKFAFPSISYLPEKQRITKNGAQNAIRNTTLGGSPFHVTPIKMAEMYGRLFSQNRKYKLTLNPDYEQEYEPFIRPKEYASGGIYEDILNNYLFKGMSKVPIKEGTASALDQVVSQIKEKGYCVYAKTGTIRAEGADNDSQFLAVIITKGPMHGIDKKTFMKRIMEHKFYVLYYQTVNNYHDYSAIGKSLMTVVNSSEFNHYMNPSKSVEHED